MEVEKVYTVIQWMTAVGQDGAIHRIPHNEEHIMHFGCHCDPVCHRYYAGGIILVHRVLSC